MSMMTVLLIYLVLSFVAAFVFFCALAIAHRLPEQPQADENNAPAKRVREFPAFSPRA